VVNVCYLCGEQIKHMPHRCKYCYEQYCDKHSLPENHNCICLPKKRIRTSIDKVEVNGYDPDYVFEALVFAVFCVWYLFLGLWFTVSGLVFGFFVGCVYFFNSVLLGVVMKHFCDLNLISRFSLGFVQFNGLWKRCYYVGSMFPVDCRVCDQRKKSCVV